MAQKITIKKLKFWRKKKTANRSLPLEQEDNMNNSWFRAAIIRAVRTIAQTAIATIGTAAVLSSVDWKYVASASILSGILSILTSLSGLPEVKEEK